jgi:3-oxosteroid 1-dehydrogenase
MGAEWFSPSGNLAELSAKTGIDEDGLAHTLAAWNANPAHAVDPDFRCGSSAYDGYWGDNNAATIAGQTLGPIDTAPYYAVPVWIGAMGTKGGPRTDCDGRVPHACGSVIPGLFAAGNAMAGRRARPTAAPAGH